LSTSKPSGSWLFTCSAVMAETGSPYWSGSIWLFSGNSCTTTKFSQFPQLAEAPWKNYHLSRLEYDGSKPSPRNICSNF
jgi:hypothetical protein